MNHNLLSISIVIPVYNEEDYIGPCLDAISAQTVKPDEVIVVDNNCTDNTIEIARRYSFVKVVKETRQGLYFSRNTGMDSAKNEIIGRIDADTQISTNWVETALELFSITTTQVATGPLGYYDMPFVYFFLKLDDKLLKVARLLGYKFLFGPNMLIRKSAWDKIKNKLCNQPFLFEDIDLAIHLQSADITPGYSSNLTALVSARRLANSPAKFFRYIKGHSRTLAFHGKSALGAYFAESIYVFVYLNSHLIYKLFNPNTRQLSLTYFTLGEYRARPDPMDMG